VEIQDEAGRKLAARRLPEGAAGIARLHELIAAHLGAGGDPGQVVVAIETDRGLWVQALAAAGYQVFGLNPRQVARFKERYNLSGAKSDPADAHALADMVRGRYTLSVTGHDEARGAGHVNFTDLGQPCEFTQDGASASTASFQLSYDQLGFPADVVRRAGRMLPSSPVYGLVQGHMAGLCRRADELAADASAATIGHATLELAGSCSARPPPPKPAPWPAWRPSAGTTTRPIWPGSSARWPAVPRRRGWRRSSGISKPCPPAWRQTAKHDCSEPTSPGLAHPAGP
jgi:hypothetical protein